MFNKQRKKEIEKEADRGLRVLGYTLTSMYMRHGLFFQLNLEDGDYREEVLYLTEYIKEQLKEKLLDAEETSFD